MYPFFLQNVLHITALKTLDKHGISKYFLIALLTLQGYAEVIISNIEWLYSFQISQIWIVNKKKRQA